LELVLLVPQGLGQIEQALTQSGAAGVDTHISTRRARLRPKGLIVTLDSIGALGNTRRQQCGKAATHDDARHFNLQFEAVLG
jgi:hypothetical protein